MLACWRPRALQRLCHHKARAAATSSRSPDAHYRRAKLEIGSCQRHFKRSYHLPPALIPPAIFCGLFVALWCWKCTMLVLFQNTIIYNPFLPPNARRLSIADYTRHCGGIAWREETIRSLDGTQLALCVSEVRTASTTLHTKIAVYILYLQGNASSSPPRLPDISWVLRRVQASDRQFHLTTVCLSYRGYWKSHDRPSERGINKDTEAALRWIKDLHHAEHDHRPDCTPIILLWGQSIGCGLATKLAATSTINVDGLILETPFTSARAMLQALYPQKWLPYQYLWPFLRNQLDTLTNLGILAERRKTGKLPPVYIIEAGKDELVPTSHGERLERQCLDVGLPVQRFRVRGALHNDASVRAEGKEAIAGSIRSAVEAASPESAPDCQGTGAQPVGR